MSLEARFSQPALRGLWVLLAEDNPESRELLCAMLTASGALCALAGTGAMILAPSLNQHQPWVNYEALTGGLAPAGVDTFDWSQSYGPILWPRHGRTVLAVSAQRGDYWKADS
jgi:hypothetical protein